GVEDASLMGDADQVAPIELASASGGDGEEYVRQSEGRRPAHFLKCLQYDLVLGRRNVERHPGDVRAPAIVDDQRGQAPMLTQDAATAVLNVQGQRRVGDAVARRAGEAVT